MKTEVLPGSLLMGQVLRCQPTEDGPVSIAPIITIEPGLTPVKKIIVCLARRPDSKCVLRMRAGDGDGRCHYWRGDSQGEYQIIGPGMHKKLDRNW